MQKYGGTVNNTAKIGKFKSKNYPIGGGITKLNLL